MRQGIAKNKDIGMKNMKKQLKQTYQLLILLAIPLVWLILFKYGPMYGLLMAFTDYDIQKGILGSPWVGLDNFKKFFSHYQCGRVIKNTLTLSFYYLMASFPFPIILALALNCCKRKKFSKVVQTVTYMPYFISTVVLVGIIMRCV